jgi:O-acetyl-ADP-ribose deacetylase
LDDENELTSQLPDAPTAEPEDTTQSEEPTVKKQKTDIVDDDFVVVEKDDAIAAENTKH